MSYSLIKPNCPSLNSKWRIYVDAATDGSNPSSRVAIGLVCTCQSYNVKQETLGTERIYDVRTTTLVGESISNNVAEMQAVLAAYRYAERFINGKVRVYTDSRYAIDSLTAKIMREDSALTWTSINSYQFTTAVKLTRVGRDDKMLCLADFAAMLGVASGEEFIWGSRADQEALLTAFSTYKPRG
jgi:ribonuclease HI